MKKIKKKETMSSKYKGVSYCNRSNRWISRIIINGKSYYLGCSKSEREMSSIFTYVNFYLINNYGYEKTVELIKTKEYLEGYREHRNRVRKVLSLLD